VLRGGQGVGKSFFAHRVGELAEPHYLHLSDPKHLTGSFNAHLQNKVLVFGDEIYGTADPKEQGKLKTLITEDTFLVEPKGVDPFTVNRYARFIFASNESWVVPAGIDDRRFFVLDVPNDYKQDTEYFGALYTEWQSGGREALLYFLLNRDLSDFNHRERPKTAALTDQQTASLRGAQRLLYEGLQNGSLPAHKMDGQRVFVVTRWLYEERARRGCSETAVGRELQKAAEGEPSVREYMEDGQRRREYWLPPLDEARRNWAEANDLDAVRWSDDVDAWEAFEVAEMEAPF